MKIINLLLPIIYLLCIAINSFGQTQRVEFQNKKIKLKASDICKVSNIHKELREDDINAIMRNSMGAENSAKNLPVTFEMEETVVENGLFVFKIISNKKMLLNIELYDAEGFEMEVKPAELLIKEGVNYKALDVNGLKEGKYFFTFKDTTYARLLGSFTIIGAKGIKMVDFAGSQVSTSKADVIKVTKPENARQNDDDIKHIMRHLMGAEDVDLTLPVKFTMSDEPVEEGLFVFGIETEKDMELTAYMYDEEGFELNIDPPHLIINSGNNYKAFNLTSLEDGKYFFILKDDGGKELIRELTIAHKE